jgi:hypothetical protein
VVGGGGEEKAAALGFERFSETGRWDLGASSRGFLSVSAGGPAAFVGDHKLWVVLGNSAVLRGELGRAARPKAYSARLRLEMVAGSCVSVTKEKVRRIRDAGGGDHGVCRVTRAPGFVLPPGMLT